MRTTLLILVILGSTAAQAQPGQTMPPPSEDAPADPAQQPYYPPQQPYYPPQPQVVQLQLTEEQQDLLAQGEISLGQYITGGILAYVAGFGIGPRRPGTVERARLDLPPSARSARSA